uniref:Uncharacterized protein n=1 Tax=Rhizophora mucronata TaxID=61149 RepID=A0A2P2PU86_RHIMU
MPNQNKRNFSILFHSLPRYSQATDWRTISEMYLELINCLRSYPRYRKNQICYKSLKFGHILPTKKSFIAWSDTTRQQFSINSNGSTLAFMKSESQ